MIYGYRATVRRVVDGDTIDFDVDLGFYMHAHIRVRLLGVDTPEIYGVKKGSEEYEAGKEATEFTKKWLEENVDEDGTIYVETFKNHGDKYGRWLAVVGGSATDTLNDALEAAGYGTE